MRAFSTTRGCNTARLHCCVKYRVHINASCVLTQLPFTVWIIVLHGYLKGSMQLRSSSCLMFLLILSKHQRQATTMRRMTELEGLTHSFNVQAGRINRVLWFLWTANEVVTPFMACALIFGIKWRFSVTMPIFDTVLLTAVGPYG